MKLTLKICLKVGGEGQFNFTPTVRKAPAKRYNIVVEHWLVQQC